MKIVFLSDIHSNWNYLSQIKSSIENEYADKIFFLGDAIGYYDEPNKVLDYLREINAICVKGNHENYLLGELSYKKEALEEIYKVEYNKKLISSQNISFIKSWNQVIDIKINDKRFLLLHADIDDKEKHIYQVDQIDKKILEKYDYYVYGHTHLPLIQYSYGCCILNPGSIGQPRDYTTMPSYIVLNLESNEITIKKIDIKNREYIEKLNKKKFDKKVLNILERKY